MDHESVPKPQYSEKEGLTMLSAVVRNVSKKYGMRVELQPEGSGTYFDWANVYVGIDRRDFRRDPEAWLGAAAHEGRHIDKTRFQAIPEADRNDPRFNQLLQTLEDLRMNFGLDKDYPGAGNWLRVYYQDVTNQGERLNIETIAEQSTDGLGFMPRSAEFTIALQRSWAFGDYGIPMHPDTQKALDETKEWVDKYKFNDVSTDAPETEKMQAQYDNYTIVKKNIWPKYTELLQKDKEDIEVLYFIKYLASPEGKLDSQLIDSELTEEERAEYKVLIEKMETYLEQRKKDEEYKKQQESNTKTSLVVDPSEISPGLRKKLKKTGQEISEKKMEEMKKEAEKLLKDLEDAFIKYLRPKLQDPLFFETNLEAEERAAIEAAFRSGKAQAQAGSESGNSEAVKGITKYQIYHSEVAKQVDELALELDDFFIPNKFPRWRKGFSDGPRTNMTEAMQFDVNRQNYNKLYERKTIPQKVDAGFSIDLDKSGSMRHPDPEANIKQGEKFENAKKAIIVFAETLDRVSIPFEIVAYPEIVGSDEHGFPVMGILVIKDFREPYTQEVKKKIIDMIADGGNTPTGMSIEETSKRIDSYGITSATIINITDGDPDDEVVEKIRETESGGKVVVGLGIGNGISQDSIEGVYTHGKLVKNIKDLPKEVMGILRNAFL